MLGMAFSGLPLVICGALKIAYDVALLLSFRHIKPPEEAEGAVDRSIGRTGQTSPGNRGAALGKAEEPRAAK
jgi:hypothetical protein